MENTCKDCKHYKVSKLDGPFCTKTSYHRPVSPIMVKDCFEERPPEPEPEAVVEQPAAPPLKHCPKCGRDLPVTEFNRNSRMKDGRQSECRECVAKYGKASRKKLNEKKRAEKQEEVQKQLEAGVKVCKKCGRTLPLSAFSPGHAADGLQAICKECKSEWGRLANARRRQKEADAVRKAAAEKEPEQDPPRTEPMSFEFECAVRSFEVMNPIPGGLVEIRLVAAQEDVQAAAMLALSGKILTIKIGAK